MTHIYFGSNINAMDEGSPYTHIWHRFRRTSTAFPTACRRPPRLIALWCPPKHTNNCRVFVHFEGPFDSFLLALPCQTTLTTSNRRQSTSSTQTLPHWWLQPTFTIYRPILSFIHSFIHHTKTLNHASRLGTIAHVDQ